MWLRRRGQLTTGILVGIALVFVIRGGLNATPVADWLVQPLLMNDHTGPADAILVSGAGVIGDCIPNRSGTQRILRAARLWREGLAPIVVITGGSGSDGCTVARAMAELLQEIGVPASRIRLETASRSTHENAAFVAPLLRGWNVSRVLLVTDRLHMRRAGAALSAEGLVVERSSVPIYEGHPDNVSMLFAGLREYAALAYYGARGWLAAQDESVPGHKPAAFVAPVAPANPDGPIAILGASYAAGLPLSAVAGRPVVNLGVVGQETADLRGRFDRDVVARRPRAVILWGFINDVVRAQDGTMDATVQRIQENVGWMIARARHEGITPILATEVTIGPPPGTLNQLAGWIGRIRGKESYQDRINRQVMAVNRWLKDVSSREALPLLDLQPMLAEPDGRRRALFTQPDGSHITAAGYAMLMAYTEPILEEFFRER